MAARKTEPTMGVAPTWRDLLPSQMPLPLVISRAELLAQLEGGGAAISERTLRFWETEGVLPRAVRQAHHGVVQAVYPAWFPLVVAAMRLRREQGQSVSEIAGDMPRVIHSVALLAWAYEHNLMPLDSLPQGEQLRSLLTDLVRDGSVPGRPITRVMIQLLDEGGLPAHNIVWNVPGGTLADGVQEGPPPDSRLSGGGPSIVADDSVFPGLERPFRDRLTADTEAT